MAHIDQILSTAPVARIAGPHQSTAVTILRSVELGLFAAAQAKLMIDRVRAHLTALPVTTPIPPLVALSSVADGLPATVSGHASDTLLAGLDRTF